MTATFMVKYSIGTYVGTVVVRADADADTEHVIARARTQLRRRVGHLPTGAASWRVVSAEDST